MKLLRLLLLPFSAVYAIVIMLRNTAYDLGLFKSHKFTLPVISIGNLAVGGSGKSPMAEYLIGLLKDKYKVATLSRGYGRFTTGFIELSDTTSADEAGDEPVQFKHKFPDVTVAVCEDRVTGIEHLRNDHDVIILDDAFQHRAVKPGLSLLLFDYNSLTDFQILLPAGNLREPVSGRKRAHVLLITKCPPHITYAEQQELINRIKPLPGQQVFFSFLEYGNLRLLNGAQQMILSAIVPDTQIFLLTGIANPSSLLTELNRYTNNIIHHAYPDHHRFSAANITKLMDACHSSNAATKLVITTEKDAQRLRSDVLSKLLEGVPVYYLPIKAKIIKDEDRFNRIIGEFASTRPSA